MAEKGKPGVGKFVASFIELFSRVITILKGDDHIYKNDSDNLYPNRVEIVEKNSPTASSASEKLKAFILGRGFVNDAFNEQIVNPKKNISGYEFLELLANSISTHKGAFIHVNYDVEGNVNYLDVLKYKKCRISQEDDVDNKGKIYYKDWEKKTGIGQKDDVKFFYPFNSEISVINEQRLKDSQLKKSFEPNPEELIQNYRGQVFFFSLESDEVYPHAWLHSAYNDADSEFRLGVYRNSNYRTGFLNKTILITNGLDEESHEEFESTVQDWLGAENSGSVMVLNPSEQIPDPSNIIATVELKGTYDSKRFDNDEKSIANNIRKAYLTIPKILIDPEDSFFGSSGEAFKEAVKYYNAETLFIREKVAHLMDNFYQGDYTIKQLGDDVESE